MEEAYWRGYLQGEIMWKDHVERRGSEATEEEREA